MSIHEAERTHPSSSKFGTKTIKQPAFAAKGMVTSNHPLASMAGNEMLILGGNAVDAAISTMFTLSVVEPMMTTIFGGRFHRHTSCGRDDNNH